VSGWSPFLSTRFEHLTRPVIWLPPIVARLEAERSVYLTGSRGTGKTTLLKALHYELRLRNLTLRRQLGADPFVQRYIGLYIRFPDFVTRSFSRWGDTGTEQVANGASTRQERDQAFALLVELQVLQLLQKAIADLRDEGVLLLHSDLEASVVATVMNSIDELRQWAVTRRVRTFRELQQTFYRAHADLQKRLFSSKAFTIDDYPIRQVGGVLSEVASLVLSRFPEADSNRPWRVKVCLDEAESLLPWQQVVMNSIVRYAKTPLSFVLAYVNREINTIDTLDDALPLSNADRIVEDPLDRMKPGSFRDLVDNVVDLYLWNAHSDQGVGESPHLDVERLLGGTNVNALLLARIREHKREKSLEFLALAAKLAGGEIEDGSPPPIYQAYIHAKLGIELPVDMAAPWERRQFESRNIRKRMVAALLCMCAELDWSVPYSGAEVAFDLSHKCIRDFLDIMHFLYTASGVEKDIAKFCNGRPLHIRKQTAAFLNASENKLNVISSEVPHYQTQVMNMVTCLGLLLRQLQADHTDTQCLRTPERGVFELRLANGTLEQNALCLTYLQRAVDGGATKIVGKNDRSVQFILHHLLGPNFGFSYRGPYYKIPTEAIVLLAAAEAKDKRMRAAAVNLLRKAARREKVLYEFTDDDWL